MKKNIFKGLAATGLVALVNLSGCGNRINNKNLPANNIDFGRHMEVYEEDAQQGINNSLVFGANPCRNGDETDIYVSEIEDKNGRKAPFDAYIDCKTDSNNKQKCELRVEDNSRYFVSGEIWNVRIGANCEGLDNDSIRTLHVTYLAGSSPDRLDDRLDNVEDEVFHYVVDDGKCDSHLGENNQNSPYDCPNINEPEPQMTLEQWACANLPRAYDNVVTANIDEGADLRVFVINRNGNTFSYTENRELPASEYPDIHHKIDKGGGIYAITAGTSLGNIRNMYSNGISGYNSSECSDIYFLNGENNIINADNDFTVYASGEEGLTAEVIRPY